MNETQRTQMEVLRTQADQLGIIGGARGVWPEEDNTHGVFEIEVAIGHLNVRQRKKIESLCPDTNVEFVQVDSFPDGSNPSDDEVVEFLKGAMPGTFDIEGEVSIFLPHCWVVFGGRAHDVSLIRLRPFTDERSTVSALACKIAQGLFCTVCVEWERGWVIVGRTATPDEVEAAPLSTDEDD